MILALIITIGITFVLAAIIHIDPTGDMVIQIIFTAISVIAMIPAIYIGNKLLFKIPFSTQVAPIRQWNWGIYIKAFIITLAFYGVMISIQLFTTGLAFPKNLPIAIFLLFLILPLFQGFAEEFAFRGLFMQTFGSWFKIPIVAIVFQAVLFSVLHRYPLLALISVICTGVLYGFIVWYSQGLEVSSAMHAVNNIFSFLAIGFGLQQGTSGNSPDVLFTNLVLLAIPIIIVLVLDKKFGFLKA